MIVKKCLNGLHLIKPLEREALTNNPEYFKPIKYN